MRGGVIDSPSHHPSGVRLDFACLLSGDTYTVVLTCNDSQRRVIDFLPYAKSCPSILLPPGDPFGWWVATKLLERFPI